MGPLGHWEAWTYHYNHLGSVENWEVICGLSWLVLFLMPSACVQSSLMSSACALAAPDVPVGSATQQAPVFRCSPELHRTFFVDPLYRKWQQVLSFLKRVRVWKECVPTLTLQDFFKESPGFLSNSSIDCPLAGGLGHLIDFWFPQCFCLIPGWSLLILYICIYVCSLTQEGVCCSKGKKVRLVDWCLKLLSQLIVYQLLQYLSLVVIWGEVKMDSSRFPK